MPRTISLPKLITLLQEGEMEIKGLLPYGSNYTFLAVVGDGQQSAFGVYKPIAGEQPLWDFPNETLALREVAAFLVSEALGWGLVPPTIYRLGGPHGPGSLQWFIQAEPDRHYFTLTDEEKQRRLPAAALFDILINNADRKGGHVLFDTADKLWLIDHGICFHAQPKLRTVIWDFAGQPIHASLLAGVRKLHAKLEPDQNLKRVLGELLSPVEISALRRRAGRLLESGCFPQPGPGRNYPWPAL